jgi:GNAT superfamily N-acetyltransferase
MAVIITAERADTPDAMQLIAELDASLEPLYPIDNRYGYSIDKILKEGVLFHVLRADEAPAGCGGIQFYGDEFGELKRMYVRPAFRGRGFGKLLVEHLTAIARERGMPLVRLETGIYQTTAIALYESLGFRQIPPFGVYKPDPLSRCYEKSLR